MCRIWYNCVFLVFKALKNILIADSRCFLCIQKAFLIDPKCCICLNRTKESYREKKTVKKSVKMHLLFKKTANDSAVWTAKPGMSSLGLDGCDWSWAVLEGRRKRDVECGVRSAFRWVEDGFWLCSQASGFEFDAGGYRKPVERAQQRLGVGEFRKIETKLHCGLDYVGDGRIFFLRQLYCWL